MRRRKKENFARAFLLCAIDSSAISHGPLQGDKKARVNATTQSEKNAVSPLLLLSSTTIFTGLQSDFHLSRFAAMRRDAMRRDAMRRVANEGESCSINLLQGAVSPLD